MLLLLLLLLHLFLGGDYHSNEHDARRRLYSVVSKNKDDGTQRRPEHEMYSCRVYAAAAEETAFKK